MHGAKVEPETFAEVTMNIIALIIHVYRQNDWLQHICRSYFYLYVFLSFFIHRQNRRELFVEEIRTRRRWRAANESKKSQIECATQVNTPKNPTNKHDMQTR